MVTFFINTISTAVGTTEVIAFTATEKSMLVGGTVVNLLGSTVPFNLKLRRGATDVYLHKGKRIETGETFALDASRKTVLAVGDKLVVSADADSAMDIVFSILQGVS
jgi:hypothetical protein